MCLYINALMQAESIVVFVDNVQSQYCLCIYTVYDMEIDFTEMATYSTR